MNLGSADLIDRTVAPDQLSNVAAGLNCMIHRDEIFRINHPNYDMQDILVDRIEISFQPYNRELKGCAFDLTAWSSFPSTSNIPELQWDHLSMTVLIQIMTQVGKVSHNLAYRGTKNIGVAWRRTNRMDFKRVVPLEPILMKSSGLAKERRGHIWAYSRCSFHHNDHVFATADTVSRTYSRDYTALENKRRQKE